MAAAAVLSLLRWHICNSVLIVLSAFRRGRMTHAMWATCLNLFYNKKQKSSSTLVLVMFVSYFIETSPLVEWSMSIHYPSTQKHYKRLVLGTFNTYLDRR